MTHIPTIHVRGNRRRPLCGTRYLPDDERFPLRVSEVTCTLCLARLERPGADAVVFR